MRYFESILATRKSLIARCQRPKPAPELLGTVLNRFLKFSKLPFELRTMIWRLALPGPRILECSRLIGFFSRPAALRESQQLVLNIALSCNEAFLITMNRYKKYRLRQLAGKSPEMFSFYTIDHTCDIFYIYHEQLSEIVDPYYYSDGRIKAIKPIRRLAVSINREFDEWNAGMLSFGICDRLEVLEEIIFVADEERFMAGMLSGETDFSDFFYKPGKHHDSPMPIIQLDLWAEPDHPYLALYGKEISDLKALLETDEVAKALKGVKITFELWRRPRMCSQ